MEQRPITAATPRAFLKQNETDSPVHFFCPPVLSARLREFQDGFPGRVTFAVKSNPADHVLDQMLNEGIDGFDVASPEEIAQIRRLSPDIPLHYNNPVRSMSEIRFGIANGVMSWSVDCDDELDKLLAAPIAADNEIAVRFKLPVEGAVYNFGAKFGASEAEAVALLKRVAASGHQAALTFHVGTQCTDPAAFGTYVTAAAEIARQAGVPIKRLNVGGGFPSARTGRPATLAPFFDAIKNALSAFDETPILICEPGRGLSGDAYAYSVPVKSVRSDRVYLNDGIYGGLSEMIFMTAPFFRVLKEDGEWREGEGRPRAVFGPTCDSLDRLKYDPDLPSDIKEGDVILFRSMGAYVTGVTTRFNGYGAWQTVIVDQFDEGF